MKIESKSKDIADQLEDDLQDDMADPDPVKVLVEKFKKEIDFIEPQSMNYDIKITHIFKEFLKYS